MTLSPLPSRLQHFSTIAGFVSLLVGTLVLLGWTAHSIGLTSVLSDLFVMKPTTALGLILLGTALWCRSTERRVAQRIAAGCAFAVAAMGVLTILAYLLEWNPGFDQWLFQDLSETGTAAFPGRMGFNTALCFFLFGVSLLLNHKAIGSNLYWREGLTLSGLCIAFIALLGYLYQTETLYGIGQYTPMALHTSLTLLIVGVGILSLYPDRGLLAVATSDQAGSHMLRYLLPGIMLLLPAIGWIRLMGERHGLYGTGLGLAFLVTLATLTLFSLLWWTARSLNLSQLALRESEERFEKAFRLSPHPMGITELESGVCLDANDACLRLFGFSREEVIGTSTLDLHIWPSPAHRAQFVQLLRTRGSLQNMEITLQTKRGEARQFLFSSELIELKGILSIVTVGNDITERKEAERTLRQAHDELESRVLQRTQELTDTNAALRESERQMRHSEMFLSSVLEHLPNMVFVKDADDLRFVRINKTGEDLVGYPREALLGRSDYDFFPVAQADFFTAKDREVLQGGRLVDIPEEPIQTIDRGLRILHTKKIPLFDAAGNAHYLLGISEDITEHKQAEEALAERARLAEFSAEVSLALNTECSIDERLRHCTEAIVRHMGAAFARIWTVEPGDLCDGCFKKDLCSDRTRCLHLRASAGLSTNLSGEYRRVPLGALKIGKIAQGRGVMSSNDILNDDRLPNKEWMREQGLQSFAGFPLTIEGGVYGVLALFAKIPLSEPTLKTLESTCNGVAAAIARQQAEEALRSAYGQLRDLAQRLESAKEAERQKISRELHDEFGQALTGLKLDLAWLGTKVASLHLSPGGKTIAKKTKAMSAAVDALIDAVRETATALRPSMLDDLGLIPALDWLVKQFRAKTTIDCRLETAPEIERVQMTADSSTALFRMTQEMLTNVIRHAHASTVHLRLVEAAGSLILECTDDGDGIAVHRIGQPASLGLRGMEERAALLGGSFTITGIPGIGTTARVSLPLSSVIIPTMEHQP